LEDLRKALGGVTGQRIFEQLHAEEPVAEDGVVEAEVVGEAEVEGESAG
jgi:hypothetical protein